MDWQLGFAIVVGVIFVLALVQSMFRQWRGGRNHIPLKGRLHVARQWLEDNDYQIVRVRERSEWIGYYDSREFRKQYIADFIVKQGGKFYVVKIHSSRDTGLSGQKLRDHWYPLYMAFQVDGVLHLDVEREQVHVVDFELRSPPFLLWRRVINRSLWFLAGMIVALAWFHVGS